MVTTLTTKKMMNYSILLKYSDTFMNAISVLCVFFLKIQPHLYALVLVVLFVFANSSFILDSGMQNSVKRDKLLYIYNETIVLSQGVDRYGYTSRNKPKQNKTNTEN